jgi:hypothetical protein
MFGELQNSVDNATKQIKLDILLKIIDLKGSTKL